MFGRVPVLSKALHGVANTVFYHKLKHLPKILNLFWVMDKHTKVKRASTKNPKSILGNGQ